MLDASKCVGEFCQMTMQMKETSWLTNIYWTWEERIPKLKANHSVLVGNPRKSMLKSRHMPIPSIPPLLYFADLHRWSHSIIWALYNYILIYLDLIQCPLTEWLLDQPVPGQSDDKPRSCHLGQDRHVCLVPFKTISIIPNRSQGTIESYNPLSKSLVTCGKGWFHSDKAWLNANPKGSSSLFKEYFTDLYRKAWCFNHYCNHARVPWVFCKVLRHISSTI